MGKQDRFCENEHKKERRNAACPELNNEIYIEKARHRVVPFCYPQSLSGIQNATQDAVFDVYVDLKNTVSAFFVTVCE